MRLQRTATSPNTGRTGLCVDIELGEVCSNAEDVYLPLVQKDGRARTLFMSRTEAIRLIEKLQSGVAYSQLAEDRERNKLSRVSRMRAARKQLGLEGA